MSWKGSSVYGKRDFQFGLIAAQDSAWKTNWDPKNDWSRDGLGKASATKTKKITVYRDGTKIFGDEPTSASPETPEVDPSESPETPDPPAELSCTVAYKADNWSTGFINTVTVTNSSSVSISEWELALTLGAGQTIVNSWNATITGTSGPVSVRGGSGNIALGAGGSTSFGYQGSLAEGSYAPPSAPTLNGTLCTAG